MKKVREYELLLVRFMWVCLLIGFIYVTMDNLFSINHVILYHGRFRNVYWDYLYFAVVSLLLIIINKAVCKEFYDSEVVYYAAKTLGFAGVSFALEDTNKKLSDSIAEFETLQQISQAISSIFDVKELLRSVNDIILGVMGVNFSTIILFDEKKKKLKVHTTNIKDQEDLVMLNENVNCSVLNDVLINGKPIIENFIDPDEFAFTKGRNINSLICVPLITKTKRYGLVLIEHKYYNAFDANNVRLLDIIGQQVGITMENAELYQKMQELANTDGLTGLYNRLYFQKTFQQEFARAVEDYYHLCVAIFDIDHFKKFNDTFGHLFGDKVLKVIANVVRNSIRSTDMIARYGGEEFIITFPRTDINEAYEKVDRLRREIARTLVRDGNVTASVTASFGLSCYPDSAGSENELLSSADYALYMAKSSGRNCIRVSKHNKFIYASQNYIE